MHYKWNTVGTCKTWRIDIHTRALVRAESEYLLSLPIHTFYIIFLQGWSTQPQVAGLCGRCLQDEQAYVYLTKTERRKRDQTHTHPCLSIIHTRLYIFCILYSDTHWDSRIRAKLEPSGPHITWAMLISCLLDSSGEPLRISETPTHTRYSLRSGTLESHDTYSN